MQDKRRTVGGTSARVTIKTHTKPCEMASAMDQGTKRPREMATCVHRNHQIPYLCRAFFQRRSPRSISARSTRSDMNVEKTPTLLCSVRKAPQDSVSSSQTALDVTAPNSKYSQVLEVQKSRGGQTINVRADIRKPEDRGERDDVPIAIPECNPETVSCLNGRKSNDFLLTHATQLEMMRRRMKGIQTSAGSQNLE